MPLLTIVFAAALIVLGLVSYIGTGASSPTALIPCAFGLLLLAAGLAALRESWRTHAMHVASAVGLLGLLGAAVGLAMRAHKASGAAIASQAVMTGLCGVYFALCLKSFIDARIRRKTSSDDGEGA